MSKRKRTLVICILLAVVTLTAFWHVKDCSFINYDDNAYVLENNTVLRGITKQGIAWAFTSSYAANWHPLTWLSHMLDVELFGLEPRGHHIVNLLLHLANTILLFLVLQRMTRAIWQSAFVAALFALHPLHVQSVVWIAERKDVLSTLFWMLAMGAYASYVERPGLRRYLAVFVCFALGLMAKPMLVTLPFVLLLLDYWPLRRLEGSPRTNESLFLDQEKEKKKTPSVMPQGQPTFMQWGSIGPLLLEKIPLFVLAAVSSIVTFVVQHHEGAVGSTKAYPLSARAANAFVSYISYIVKMFWPTDLAIFYPHPGSWPIWKVLGSVVLVLGITMLAIKRARNHPHLAVGWLWYLGTLVPVIGIVQVGAQSMADRYTYVPLIGIFVILAWGVPQLLRQWRFRRPALCTSFVISILLILFLTRSQVPHWKDSISLWDHALEVTGPNAIANNSKGDAYFRIGNYAQAMVLFNQAIELNPRYADAHFGRGTANGRLGNFREAVLDFNRAIELNPRNADYYYNRGTVFFRLQKLDQAMSDFNRAIEIDPLHSKAYYNRGTLHGRFGDDARAMMDFSEAIEIDPKYALAYFNRGVASLKLGKEGPAIEDLKVAAKLGYEEADKVLKGKGIKP